MKIFRRAKQILGLFFGKTAQTTKISFSQAPREFQRYNQLILWLSKPTMEKPLVLPIIDRQSPSPYPIPLFLSPFLVFPSEFPTSPCLPQLSVFATLWA